MQVGISLLTLVPRVSGGSETYARELVRALGRVGRALLPRPPPEHREPTWTGLPSEVVDEYRAARSMPGRIAAMTEGVVRGRRLRRRLAGVDVVHFPLTVMIPRVSTPPPITTVLDLQHEFLPQFFSRAERAYRRAVYGWSIRKSKLVVTISEHAARAVIERYDVPENRVRPIHLGLDHEVFRPGDDVREPFLVYPARAVAAQEPRPPLRRVRRAPTTPSRPRARAHGVRRPDSARRALARARVARRARSSVPNRCRARVPEPVRGLRPAAARGDGVRLSGCQLERRGAARRSAETARASSIRPRSTTWSPRSRRSSRARMSGASSESARAARLLVGGDGPRARRRVRSGRGDDELS